MSQGIKKRRRAMLIVIVLTAIVFWTGGCLAGQSIGLSAYVPIGDNGGKQGIVDGNDMNNGGSEMGSGESGTAVGGGSITNGPGTGETVVYVPDQEGAEQVSSGDREEQTAVDPDETKPVDDQSGGAANPSAGSETKLAALTFDDGPDTRYTTAILDILAEKDVKATFFVVGTQAAKYPEVMKRIQEEGHGIGNHTHGHKDLRKLSKAQIITQIAEADKAIEEAIGYTPSLFRAPYGAVSDTLKAVLQEQNRRLVGWTVDTRDWAGTSIADMRDMIATETKPGGIILMHSFGGKHIGNTVEMLADVIDDLHKLGFTLVTVDQIP